MPHLAHRIPQNQHITVVCYALNIAEILSQRSDVRLIVLGGLYHPEAASFSGDEGIDVLKRVNINKAFLSAGGVDEQHGVTCSHFHEVPIKQMAMQRAVEKHLVVDKSKYGKVRAALRGHNRLHVDCVGLVHFSDQQAFQKLPECLDGPLRCGLGIV